MISEQYPEGLIWRVIQITWAIVQARCKQSETAGKGLIQYTQAEDQEPDNKATRND